jgi:predicted glycosyltransferase
VFKFHPDCPYRFIARDTGILPEHFIISDKPSGDLLKESHVLLYTSSATSIEAIALGVPVLHIKSDSTIDRDNLSDFPSSVRESVSTPDDIVKATERLLKMDEKELSRKRLLWAEVVAEMFGTVDESTFDLFL